MAKSADQADLMLFLQDEQLISANVEIGTVQKGF